MSRNNPSNQPQGPSGNDPVDLTIANQVAKIVDGPPATQLITVLLKHVAVDVGTFTRDIYSSGQVYSRSLKVYDHIRQLITRVDTSTDLASQWDAFEHYTIAIPILERVLIDFYTLFYSESKDDRRDHLPPSTGVETAFIFIETWRKDRKMLRDTLMRLKDAKFLALSPDIKTYLQANPQTQRANDDLSTFRAFSTSFSSSPFKKIGDRDIIQPRGQRLVTNVRAFLDGIIEQVTKSPPAEETSRIVIMSLMIAYIPFSMIASDKTEQGWKDHLRSHSVWVALKSLLDNVDKHLKTAGKQPPVSELDIEWEKVKDLLLKLLPTLVDTKDEILDLLKLAANIRRPFHGRSVELIRMLFLLDSYSRETASVTRHRKALKDVIDDFITTLEATRDAVSDVKSITLNEEKYTKQESELNAALSKVKDVFATFGISEQWTAKEQAYQSAAAIDTSHLTMMRERLNLDKEAKRTT